MPQRYDEIPANHPMAAWPAEDTKAAPVVDTDCERDENGVMLLDDDIFFAKALHRAADRAERQHRLSRIKIATFTTKK